ncbi:MAG: glycosyltransferase family 2 protein [Candidatus Levybacteria bacterium]|nr:glycosyltransferase family 2 protein [Candidatus Levybacteria bacterium]
MVLSIIIPVYNEEKTVAAILEKLRLLSLPMIDKEIIVVDDGSSDKTVEKIKSFKKTVPTIKLAQHKENMGKGVAIQTGASCASGDYILIQDADLEYDPKDISLLLHPILEKKADVVYGTRLKRLPNLRRDERTVTFLIHYFGNRFLSLVTSILYGQWITDMETGYKLFPKKFLEKNSLRARGFDIEPEITAKLLKGGYKIMEIPISTNPRSHDEGKKLNALTDGPVALMTLVKYRFVD